MNPVQSSNQEDRDPDPDFEKSPDPDPDFQKDLDPDPYF